MSRFGALLLISLLAIVSCTRKPPEKVVLHVVSAQVPLAGVEIAVDGKVLGESDASGEFVFPALQPNQKVLVVALRPKDPLSPFAPTVASVDVPLAFFPETLEWKAQLFPLNSGSEYSAPDRAAQTQVPGSASQSSQTSEIPVTRSPTPRDPIGEDELPPEVTATPVVGAMAIPVAAPSPSPTPHVHSPSIAAAPREGEGIPVEVAVTQSGAPLAGAQVFALRAQTRSPIFLGTTGADGVASGNFPRSLRMDQFLVRHQCCKSEFRPPSAGKRTTISLEKSSGAEFVIQSDAFGIARAVPGTELFSGPLRVDVAGPVGFLSVPAESVKAGAVSLFNREAIPERFDVKVEKDGKKVTKPVVRYAGTRKPPLPTLGILEFGAPSDENRDSSSLLWRRFRREFHARFLQGQPFRPLIASEVSKLAGGARLSLENLLERGWEFTVLNTEMDFVVSLKFEAHSGQVECKLEDRSGNVLFHGSDDLGGNSPAPEKLAGVAFDKMVERLPFEGTVTSVDGDKVMVNLGSEGGRLISKGQFFEIYGSKEPDGMGLRSQFVASGNVENVEALRSAVRVTLQKGGSKILPTVGMRVVRVSAGAQRVSRGDGDK
jgi:hypothetical protein